MTPWPRTARSPWQHDCVTLTDADTSRFALSVEPGPSLRLSVADTGAGIPAAALPHIVEPFFTTKEIGKGTGLGLATVAGCVRDHRERLPELAIVLTSGNFCAWDRSQLRSDPKVRLLAKPARGEDLLDALVGLGVPQSS